MVSPFALRSPDLLSATMSPALRLDAANLARHSGRRSSPRRRMRRRRIHQKKRINRLSENYDDAKLQSSKSGEREEEQGAGDQPLLGGRVSGGVWSLLGCSGDLTCPCWGPPSIPARAAKTYYQHALSDSKAVEERKAKSLANALANAARTRSQQRNASPSLEKPP